MSFVSRAQMGWMWHNKKDLYAKKLGGMAGLISSLPWKVGRGSLKGAALTKLSNARKMLAEGKLTTNGFEAVRRNLYPRTHKPTRAERMGRGQAVPKLGRIVGRKDNQTRRRR